MSITVSADKAILKDSRKHDWDAHSFPKITEKSFRPTRSLKITRNLGTWKPAQQHATPWNRLRKGILLSGGKLSAQLDVTLQGLFTLITHLISRFVVTAAFGDWNCMWQCPSVSHIVMSNGAFLLCFVFNFKWSWSKESNEIHPVRFHFVAKCIKTAHHFKVHSLEVQLSKCSEIDSAFCYIKLTAVCFFLCSANAQTLTDREIKAESQ